MQLVVDIIDPTFNLLKHESNCECVILEVATANNDNLKMVFINKEALTAFFGLGNFMLEHDGHGHN